MNTPQIDPSTGHLDALASESCLLCIHELHAGYRARPIIHAVSLRLGRGQSLCLIGPNGAGKSTVLNAIFGFCKIYSGSITISCSEELIEVTHLPAKLKLAKAGIAYVPQDGSVFAGMTVEENLMMGGFLCRNTAAVKQAVERIFDQYPRLAARRQQRAGVLSGGERRLLEISRALIMDPPLLLLDEPSIGLEPRFIDTIFEMLHDLQARSGKSIVMVEQNTRSALALVDIACVMVSGRIVLEGSGSALLDDPAVESLFLGALNTPGQ